MASVILANLQEEVAWPIRLELLTEPLSPDCGQSFYQACITPNDKESNIGQEGESNCPVCRFSYEPGNLRPNRHEASIVQRFRKVKGSLEEQNRNLCTMERNSHSSVRKMGSSFAVFASDPGALCSPHVPLGGGCPTVPGKRPELREERPENDTWGEISTWPWTLTTWSPWT